MKYKFATIFYLFLIFGCATTSNDIDWYRNCVIKANFDGDTIDGPFELYTPNGKILQKGVFVDMKKDGIWEYWESTGIKIAEIKYKEGKIYGPIKLWYGSYINSGKSAGKLKLEGIFVDDKYDGTLKTFQPNGLRRTIIIYDQGNLINAKFYDQYEKIVPVNKNNAKKYAEEDLNLDLKLFSDLDEFTYESIKYSKSLNRN